MKKIFLFVAALFLLTLHTTVNAQKHKLIKLWETDTLLKVPESVLYDEMDKVLFASNIDGTDPWGKDGKGSIAKIGLDGKIIAVEWVKGLDAPKGMGLYRGNLYVADLTHIVVINIKKAVIEKTIPVDGAVNLNDVSVDMNGVIYVSDSKLNKIYRVENGVVSVYVDKMKGANGVLMRGKDFYFLDAGGIYKLNSDNSSTMIADGMEGGTDGIENVQGNDFLVSCWQGAVWYVHADGTKELLLDTKADKKNTADIGFDPKTKTVYVPTFWKNSVVAYKVSEE
jgi:sugar lactone lactonase YvrE